MPGPARRTINERANRRSPSAVIANSRHQPDGGDRLRPGESPPRFPIARQGYDRAIVDERFAELEQELIELDRELAHLQASTPPRDEAAGEIDRIGKQVSAILIAAHESADETRRLADAEAGHRLADAEGRARSITEDANRELSALHDEIASLRRERDRLLDDIRSIAERLHAVAENPSSGLPAQPADESPPTAER
jgi:cell division septum initiation protein DivIVA